MQHGELVVFLGEVTRMVPHRFRTGCSVEISVEKLHSAQGMRS